jgi:hypothetical protein
VDQRPPGEEPAEEGADQLYFQALEDLLARLRGGGLLLSPADWQVAAQWRRRGVPLELVARTMEDLYARRRERDSKRRINSLRYFAPAVEAAWEELRALTGSGHRVAPAPFDAAARLRRLASALPAGIVERERWAARIEALTGDSASVEERLAAFDEELLSASEGRLSAEQRARIDAGRDAVLSRLAARLPAEEVRVAAGRLWRQELRRELALPVLSLFSPEAQPAAEDDPAGDASG